MAILTETRPYKLISYRNAKNINLEQFNQDIDRKLNISDALSLGDNINCYNEVLSKPWINNSILKMIKHRDYFKKKKIPLIFILRVHISYFVIISQEIKKDKKEYFKQFFEDNLNNMKKTWQGTKTLINLNNNSSNHINQLYHQGKYINTNLGMAKTFNIFFTNIESELDNEIPISQRPGGPKCYLGPRIPYSFLIAPTNPKEICDIITHLMNISHLALVLYLLKC